jgi:uncharacterized protein (TIGR00162 family)
MNVEIKMLKTLQPKESILIGGLPGIAYIGKLSVDYLIQQLKAELVGEVYSKFFPPYVMIRNDGIVELMKNELYYLKNETGKDIFFLTGNAQAFSPEGQYEMADKLLDWAISLGVKKVFSIAALLTDRSFETPNVYGTTTTPVLLEEIKKYGVLSLDQGSISGINGLIIGLAKKKNIDGICLLGETRGYQTPEGLYVLDPRAVKAVLDVLTALLNLKTDMTLLDKQTKEMDDLIRKIAEIERNMREEMREATTKKPSYVT